MELGQCPPVLAVGSTLEPGSGCDLPQSRGLYWALGAAESGGRPLMWHIAFESIFCFVIASSLGFDATAQSLATNTTLTLLGPISYSAWLTVSNAPTTNFWVEVSHDLRSWQPLLSVTARKSTFDFADRDSREDKDPVRFYRTKSPGISVEEPAAAWASARPLRYRYHFRRVCFCRPTIVSGTVAVQDGTIIGVTNAFDEQISQPIPNPDLSQFRSIEQLFEEIRQAESRNADVITIKYDPFLRFPARVDVDFLVPAVDDEITYEARDVEPLN